MPAVNGVGEPCAGEPHAQIEVRREESGVGCSMPKRRWRLPPTLHEFAGWFAAGRDLCRERPQVAFGAAAGLVWAV